VDRLFVDTSAWFAYFNRSDPDHRAVVELLDGFAGRLLTSNHVFDEVVTLCLYRLGHRAAVAVGEALLDPEVVDLLRLTEREELAAFELLRARPDKSYSLTDCSSFILMRRLRLPRAAALDEDFAREGFEALPA
jgi:predicted nucleic acid-binding protein